MMEPLTIIEILKQVDKDKWTNTIQKNLFLTNSFPMHPFSTPWKH